MSGLGRLVSVDPYEVILYPLMTEVASRLLETENRVEKVNVLITPQGEKKAFVKLHPDYKAVDIAIKLGIL